MSDDITFLAGQFARRLAIVTDMVARCPDIPEVEKPALGLSEAQRMAILCEKGFPKRHVEQLSRGINGSGADKAHELCEKIIEGDSLVLLIGNRGPGKTQMSTFWAGEIIKSGSKSVLYVKTSDLIGEIKSTWHDGGKTIGTEADVLRKYRRVRYLVIDEFNDRGTSEWESRCLVNLIDHRYDDMLITVIIANLTKAQLSEINPSIYDRAKETGGIIVCDWLSYRN